jgi:hypothetical protein
MSDQGCPVSHQTSRADAVTKTPMCADTIRIVDVCMCGVCGVLHATGVPAEGVHAYTCMLTRIRPTRIDRQ